MKRYISGRRTSRIIKRKKYVAVFFIYIKEMLLVGLRIYDAIS